MNPKDTGFFLKNIEKLVLAASVLLMLVLAWWFLMGNPFTFEMGGRDVGAGEIKDTVANKANRLDGRLKTEESSLPDRPIPVYSEAILEQMAETPTSLPELAPLAQAGLSKDFIPAEGGLPTYNIPNPPIAEGILTRKGHSVLSGNVPTREMEGLIKLIGNREPKDFAYVSVAATFDMDEWVERLQSGDKETRVPPRWWNSMLGIAGVMLQRQELDEVTGQWGNEVMVDPIPGQLAFKPSLAFKASTSKQSKEAIQLVRASQEQIARPDFPQTRGNILWSPPNEDAQELDAEGQRKLSKLNSKIVKLKEQIQRLQEQVLKARETSGERSNSDPVRRPPPARNAGAGGYGGAYGGGATGAARPSRSRPTGRESAGRNDNTPSTPEERINLFQEQLIEIKLQRDDLLGVESDVLSKQGYAGDYGGGGYDAASGGYGGGYGHPGSQAGGYGRPSSYAGAYGGGGAYGQPGGAYGAGIDQTGAAEPESRKIKVWAHDLSIKPGKIYRYRVVVAVLNPLYRQKRVEENQQKEYHDKIALGPDPQELAASPWSEPVRVDSEHYFFMVNGSAQSQTARVEVWQVYDGRWVSEEFDVRPGDPIGKIIEKKLNSGNRQRLNMNVGLVVVDLIQAASDSLGGGGVRMLYLDPASNRISARTIEGDRNNTDRVRLLNELALESELALSTSGDQVSPGYQ